MEGRTVWSTLQIQISYGQRFPMMAFPMPPSRVCMLFPP